MQDEGFKNLMKWIPGYELPSRKTISSVMVPALFHKQSALVKEKVNHEVSSVCITTDVWTSRNVQSFMAVTAHYITEQFEFKSVLLQCSNLPGSHTAAVLASELKDILTEWNLTNKVNFAVSDNASAIVKAMEDILKLRHYGCYAHKLNLIVQNAVALMEETINKVKKIVAHYRRSAIAMDKLLKYQSSQGVKTPKRLKQEVSTRWNSIFYMLERFTELEETIKSTMALLDKDLPIISREEWQDCKDLCILLKPFEEMTILVSGDKYMTGSSVIVVTRCLVNVCKKIKESDQYINFCESVKEVLRQLEQGVNDRFKNVEHSNTFALCTLLDPRYKTSVFSDPFAAKKAKENLVKNVTDLIRKSTTAVTPTTPVNVDNAAIDIPCSSSATFIKAWDVFKEILSDQNPQEKINPLSRAIKEVDTYLADDVLPLKDESGKCNCQLQWWIKHKHVYPNLAKIVKTKCNVIATSVPCERLFSKSGQLISDRRSALTTQKVEMLMFLNANMKNFKSTEA